MNVRLYIHILLAVFCTTRVTAAPLQLVEGLDSWRRQDSDRIERGIFEAGGFEEEEPGLGADEGGGDYDMGEEDLQDTRISRRVHQPPLGECRDRVRPALAMRPRRRQKLAVGSLGTTVILGCRYRRSCPSSTAVTWLKEGGKVEERDKETGGSGVWIRHRKTARTGELIISDLREEDEGVYTCVVSNSRGVVTHNIHLRTQARLVVGQPEIQESMPGNHSVLLGSSLTLQCRLMVPDTSSVRWYHHYRVDGSWQNTTGSYYTRVVQDSAKLPEDDTLLQLTNLTMGDAGPYSCFFQNEYGSAVSTGWVEVRQGSPLQELQEQLDAEQTSSSRSLLLAAAVASSLGLSLAGLAMFYCCKFRRERGKKLLAEESAQTVLRWTNKVIVERLQESGGVVGAEVRLERSEEEVGEVWEQGRELYIFTEDPGWEVARELLELGEELGQGAFGRVVRGLAHSCSKREGGGLQLSPGAGPVELAVKMLKEEHSEAEVVDLVKEMEIMKAVGPHVNIVNLLGVCTQPAGRPLLALLELAEEGNLREFLQRHRDKEGGVTYRMMLGYGWQVARGMEFLASHRLVHRDLAARNVLLTAGGVAKIADFGLARDLDSSDYYRKVGEGRLPVLWMAPESLFQGLSSSQSDVWSFGVMLWEVVTWGERPYPGLAPGAVMQLVKEGYRMSRPQHCPVPLYQVMWSCWELEASQRPPWSRLVSSLQELHQGALPGIYLQMALSEVTTPPSSPESSAGSSVFTTRERSCSAPILPTGPLDYTIGRRFSEESGYNSRAEEENTKYYNTFFQQ